MKYGLYAVKDAKTTFMPVTADLNDASAVRNFEHAVMDPGSLLRTHSADYALYRVGYFDNETGLIEIEPVPVHLRDAAMCTKE